MTQAVITSIKVEIIKKVKSLLGEGQYIDTPSFLKAEDCDPLACVISSDSSSSYKEITQGRVFQKVCPIALDIFLKGKRQPEIDKAVDDVLQVVLKDRSLNGLVHNIDIKKTEVKTFDNKQKIKILMFDFEVLYHMEVS